MSSHAVIGSPDSSRWSAGRTASPYGNPFMWTGQRYDSDTGMYHFWGRSYKPTLGRFLQEDMQGIHSPVDIGISSGGNAPWVSAPAVAAQSEYGNGFNLFAYMGVNPVNGTDPLGLSWDDEVDDQISDLTGHKLYALGQLNEGAKWASLGLQTALGIATSLLPGAGLYDAFHSMGAIISGRGGFWDAVTVVAVAIPAAKVIMALRAYYKARKFERAAKAAKGGLSGMRLWGRAETLDDHFRRHGGDFGASDADDYAEQAADFLQTSQNNRLPTKIDSDGVIRVYDPGTNTFGAYNPDGTTRTFFKPKQGQAYWGTQPGSAPWEP